MSLVDWQIAPPRTSSRRSVSAVGQVAVMRDREAAGLEFGEQWLHIAQIGFAGRRIAHMADRRATGQAVDGGGVRKMIANQAMSALGVEAHAVESDDARGFLTAMLQGVQPKRGDRGGVGMIENAKDAAFLAQSVAVGVEAGLGRHVRG